MFVNVFAVESCVLTVVTFKNCIFFKLLDFWGLSCESLKAVLGKPFGTFFINVKIWQLCCNCNTTTVVLIKWLKFHTDFLSPLANIKLLFFKTKVVLGYPLSIFFIVVNEFCERFSYYGMRGENPPPHSCTVPIVLIDMLYFTCFSVMTSQEEINSMNW